MALPIISRGTPPMNVNEVNEFFKFACPPSFGGSNTDPQPATVLFKRRLLVGIDLVLRDGERVPMWIIEDPDDSSTGRTFPSKTIRIPQNAVVHADVGCSVNSHSLHWHGLEPTPMNDGVGHTSFEYTGNFPYQFQPRNAGTYFYHCHKNTVLHFEMGLYGLLLVDPPKPVGSAITGPPYLSGGPGFVVALSPTTGHIIPYDVEAFWVVDEIDRRWHTLGHNAYMLNCNPNDPVNPSNFTQDGILNDFRPDVFVLTGIPRRITDTTPITAADSLLFGPLVAPTVRVGQTLLIRALCAGYIIQQFTLGLDAEVISMDGRALGVPPYQYSHPFRLPAGTPFQLTSAMRWDLIVRPTTAGIFPATIEFFNQITGKKLYTARTSITVV